MVGVLPEEINIDWLEEWKAFFSPRTLERGLGSGFGKIRAAFLGWAGSQEMGAPLAPCWVWLVPLLRGHPGGCADPAGRGSHGNPVDADAWSCPLQPPAAEVL